MAQLLLSATAVFMLIACGSVKVKDQIFYGSKGPLGAIQLHTLTSSSKQISKADWDKVILTRPMICTSVNSFADIKRVVEQLCSVSGACDYDTTAAVDEFFAKVNSIKLK